MVDPEIKRVMADKQVLEGETPFHPSWNQLRADTKRDTQFQGPYWWQSPHNDGQSPVAAAEYLIWRAEIPVGKSLPLSGKTLGQILGGSGGAALVVAVFTGPLLRGSSLRFPAGAILMKVTDGVGDALHDVVIKCKITKKLAPELLEKPS